MTEYELLQKGIIAKEGVVRKTVTVAAGNDLVAGTIMGRITVGRKFKRSLAADADDGSRTPVAVLLEDAAAGSADVQAVIGLGGGAYVKANMTGLTETAEDALEAKGIYFL
ncbi:head decoration protein [Geobacter pelophilus]|uniref:Head decoration protein n=1 Tax=Geoanaerobacter pelophilus TaxID=60036 RepID=A0AAW4LCQ5_9BACT|nr:head decoration protein [Geoanaerobacter pelophilus]MBT0666340.1 head decoration protein [Geoanaerobacter pelophilus]